MSREHLLLNLITAIAVPSFVLSQPGREIGTAAPPPDLAAYLFRKDASFAWKKTDTNKSEVGTIYLIDLTSQTWQGIVWTHKIQVFVPKDVQPRSTMVLWNQGGTPSPSSSLLGTQLAKNIGAPVAFLYGVPNQPLFGGKKEDALIAETFVRYLDTKDSSWPLLFPMVKSLVAAMDALQAFAKDEWKFDVKDFVVTGASKRGWTSWLTAASGDKRVKAIAPMVIDTLNFPVQMKNQVIAFGKPSEMIHDYTERNLVPIPDTGAGRTLWRMVDPWVYRERILVPKMIINGANDPYWPLDALNSYWDDLKGEKYVLYVPNAGHDLRETGEAGAKDLLPTRAVSTLSAFCKCQIFDKRMPTLSWTFAPSTQGILLTAKHDGIKKSQRAWSADSDSRDFRTARWSEALLSGTADGPSIPSSGSVSIDLKHPKKGFRSMWIETEFELEGMRFPLSTQLRILEAKK